MPPHNPKRTEMNRDEAQFILRAYRANSEDACDAQFEPALAQAKRDPELAQWLAEELAFDAVFAGKIRSAIPVPPDLRRQLLLARTTAQGTPWGRRGWSALAASMAILIGAAGTLWQRTATLTEMRQFRAAMVQASMDTNGHSDVKGIGVEELRRWLVSNGGEQEYVLPAELAQRERRTTSHVFRNVKAAANWRGEPRPSGPAG